MGFASYYATQGTETGLLLIPYNFHGGGRYPGFVIGHGRQGTPENSVQPGGGSYNAAQALARIGPVLTPPLGGQNTTWGNDTAQTKLDDAITYLQNLGVRTPIGLFGMSMNGLTVLNYVRANPSKVSAVALGMPVVDLAYEHDNNVGGWATEIETSYGGSSGYVSAVAAHDPMQHTSDYVSLGIPMKIWYASDDTAAITARQQAFITATGCESSNLGAVGHTLTAVPGEEVMAFLRSHT